MVVRNLVLAIAFFLNVVCVADENKHPIDATHSETVRQENGSVKTWKTAPRSIQNATVSSQNTEVHSSSSFMIKTTASDLDEIQSFNIRERFSFSTDDTKLTVTKAIDSLYRQMVELCPKGWEKNQEWTTSSEGDFFLYYEISCR